MTERRRRPTLKDIADETGLSQAAVSYGLRGLQVPIETQERVREAAERLGYQVDPIARALASGRTGNVGLLCGSLEDIWQQGVAAALGSWAARCRPAGVDRRRDQRSRIGTQAGGAARRSAGGCADHHADRSARRPLDRRSPQRVVLVSIGDGLPGAATAAEVVFDNETAVTDALRELADAGHRRITVLTSMAESTPGPTGRGRRPPRRSGPWASTWS